MKRLAICLLLMIGLVACGDDDSDSDATAATACTESDGAADVIQSYDIDLESDHGRATFRVNRDADVGILVRIDRSSPMSLGPQIRLPLGRATANVDQIKDLVLSEFDVPALEEGAYSATLRAFEPGKLNVGEPVDTATRCFEID